MSEEEKDAVEEEDHLMDHVDAEKARTESLKDGLLDFLRRTEEKERTAAKERQRSPQDGGGSDIDS